MKLFILLCDLVLALCPSMAPNVPSEEYIYQLTQTSSLYDGKFFQAQRASTLSHF